MRTRVEKTSAMQTSLINNHFSPMGALRLSLALLLASLTSSAWATTVAESLAAVPLPFDTQVESVANEVVHNEQVMALATYESSLSVEDSLAYYHELWPADTEQAVPGVVVSRSADWLMIGHLQGDIQIVVQLRLAEPHKSSGFLSAMQYKTSVSASAQNDSADLSLPGLERLSMTQSKDGNRVSVLSVYASPQSVPVLARQLEEHWQGRGWTLVSSERYQSSRVLLLNRESAQLEIVINGTAAEYTTIVQNEVHDHG